MRLKLSILTSFCIFANFVFAQKITLQGKVVDAKDSTGIEGASIIVEGTAFRMRTDLNGSYAFIDLPAGTYTVLIKSGEFTPQKFEGVKIVADSVSNINAILTQVVRSVDEVKVVGKAAKTGGVALVNTQKNSAAVVDGTTADAIKKTGDARSSDVLKRISGASIQDNKFVIIRGLNDRYNSAYINGAPLPSSESDRKAFSFDVFSSNMLESLLISKTATPDIGAEFAGGIIQINTKSQVDSNFQSISIGTGFNTIATFKDFKTYDRGVRTKERALPSNLTATKDYASLKSIDKVAEAQKLSQNWALKNRMALPSLNLQYSLGRKFNIANQNLDMIFAYAYQNNFNTTQTVRNEFEESATGIIQTSSLKDSVFTQSSLNTAMLNFSYAFNQNNKIAFKNLYSLNSDDRVNQRAGVRYMDQEVKKWERSSNRSFTESKLYSGQLLGNHTLRGTKIQLNWIGGYNNVKRVVPATRQVVYNKDAENENDSIRYAAVVSNNGTAPGNAGNMFWSNMNETIYSGQFEFVLPIEKLISKTRIKIGGSDQQRNRSFAARNLGFSKYKQLGAAFDNSLLSLPESEIFDASHFGVMSNGLSGFKLEEATKVSDSYSASSNLLAGFVMLDYKLLDKYRFVGGVRLESYNQKFNYTEFGTNVERGIDSTVNDILPSLNFIYSPTKKVNVRLSYSKTVSRPEFRELAPFIFYNFQQDRALSGNTNLKRAKIDNFDLRFEYFPGSSQIITVSTFYKNFTNPIELITRPGTSGAPESYYDNVPRAQNYGVELEYRVKLNVFNKKTESMLLKATTIYSNFAVIRSKVDQRQILGSDADYRPLQGQSPFIANAGINFEHPTNGWAASATFNVIGNRIFLVGNAQEPSVWEKSRNVLDFQIVKKMQIMRLQKSNNIEFKLGVRDILAQQQIFFQDIDKNRKFNEASDNTWQVTNFGRIISLSVSYVF
jgi:TonB-dependent receptor